MPKNCLESFLTNFQSCNSSLLCAKFNWAAFQIFPDFTLPHMSQRLKISEKCLIVFKITEKVSFNIVSEGSYVYISSGQKFIAKNAKNSQFLRVFENLKLAVKQCYQTGQLSGKKMMEKCPNAKIQIRQFG